MFIVFLKFSGDTSRAAELVDDHKRWIQQGFDDGVFLLAGTLVPRAGGAILAHGMTAEALRSRVQADPFVAQGIVAAEIHEIAPSRADARLRFLLGSEGA